MRTKCRCGAVFFAEAPVMLDGDSRATGHAGRAASAALGPILLRLCNCSPRRVASRLLRAISNRARPVPGEAPRTKRFDRTAAPLRSRGGAG